MGVTIFSPPRPLTKEKNIFQKNSQELEAKKRKQRKNKKQKQKKRKRHHHQEKQQ